MMIFEKFADNKLTLDEFKHIKAGYDQTACELQGDLVKLLLEEQDIEECADNSLCLGKYHLSGTLTREMLIALVKKIVVSRDNTIEIVWNFKQ